MTKVQLEKKLKIATECLKTYSIQTVTAIEGRFRLNYDGTEKGPTMSFYEGETWVSGGKAKDALEKMEKV